MTVVRVALLEIEGNTCTPLILIDESWETLSFPVS